MARFGLMTNLQTGAEREASARMTLSVRLRGGRCEREGSRSPVGPCADGIEISAQAFLLYLAVRFETLRSSACCLWGEKKARARRPLSLLAKAWVG